MKLFNKILSATLATALVAGSALTASAANNSNIYSSVVECNSEVYEFDLYDDTLCFNSNSELSSVSAANKFDGSFRSELTDMQKEIYDELVEKYIAADGLPSGATDTCFYYPKNELKLTSFTGIYDDICYAYAAFVYDYPQSYWSKGISYSVGYIDYGSYYLVIRIKIDLLEKYDGAIDSIDEYKAGINCAVDEVFNSVKNSYSAYDYYKAIYNWVAKKCSYNYEAANGVEKDLKAYSSAGVFAGDGCVVCQGYSETYKIICDQLKLKKGVYGTKYLDCISVAGVGSNLTTIEDHEWNYVKMPDNNWYALDATWDDAGEYASNNYFLVGSSTQGVISGSTFNDEHVADGIFYLGSDIKMNYPDLCENEYVNTQCQVDFVEVGSGYEKSVCSTSVNKYGYITDKSAENMYLNKELTIPWNNTDMITESFSVYSSASTVPGDVNIDGDLTIDDVTLIQMYLSGISELSEQQLALAEVNGDGDITVDDATAIQMYLAGITTEL